MTTTTSTTTTTNGEDAPFNEKDTSFNGEDAFINGLEKLAGIFTGVAEKLDALADSFGTSEEEIDELNAGEAEEEIGQDDAEHIKAKQILDNFLGNKIGHDDAIAEMIAAPLVNALNSMSAILEDANEEIMDMIFDEESDTDE